jgi:hypothetical protein
MDKFNELLKYSNPDTVNKNLKRYLKRFDLEGIELYISTRKDKKYMIETPEGKTVHFGQMGYEDYTKHQDEERRNNYLKRATKIKGDWKRDPLSPNNLAIWLLW